MTTLQHEADILEANRVFKDCRLRLDSATTLRARELAAKALRIHIDKILQPKDAPVIVKELEDDEK